MKGTLVEGCQEKKKGGEKAGGEEGGERYRCLFMQLGTAMAFWAGCLLFYLIFYHFGEDNSGSYVSGGKGLVPKHQPRALKIF